MAVRLDINVRGVKGLGGPRAGAAPDAMMRQMRQMVKMQRVMARQFREIGGQGAVAMRTVGFQLDKIAKNTERQFAQTFQKVERRGLAMARRIGRALQRSMRSVGGGIAGAGSGIGGAFGALTGGGGGLGGLVRGVGGAGASLVGGAGALGGGIAGAIPGIGGMAEGIVKGISSAGAGVVQAAGNLAGMFVDKFVGIAKVGLIAGLGVAFASVAKAAQFENIQTGFKGLVRTWGVDAPEALERMRTAAKGTVSDLDLLAAANNALLLNTVDTVPQFGKLIEAGRRLGKAMGRTASEGLSDLTIGIGRQSRLILDNLGIIVKVEAANQRYAESLGKTVGALSEAEKRQAFLTAAMEGIDDRLRKLGPEVESFTDSWASFKAEVENLAVSIGQSLLPVFKDLMPELTRIATAIKEWLNDNQVELADKLRGALDGVVTTLSNIGTALSETGLHGFFADAMDWAGRFFDFLTLKLKAVVSEIRGEIRALMLEAQGAAEGSFATVALGHVADLVTPFGSTDYSEEAAGIKDRFGSMAESSRHFGRMHSRRLSERAGQVDLATFFRSRGEGGTTSPMMQSGARGATGMWGAAGMQGTGDPPRAGEAGGAGARLATTAKAVVDEASDTAARLRSIVDALGEVGVEFEGLPAALRLMLEKAAESEEKTAELRERAEQTAANMRRQSIIDATKASVDSLKTQKDKAEEVKKAAESSMEKMAQDFRDLGESLSEKIQSIDKSLESSLESIQDNSLQRANAVFSQVDSRAQQLAGLGGGMEARGGMPLKIRKAIRKVSRGRTRVRRDELRRATDGMTSDELAANDGAMLQQVLQQQAQREVGSRAQLAQILQETQATMAEAEAAALEEQEKVRAAAEEAEAAIKAKLDKEEKVLTETADALTKINERMKTAESKLDSVSKAIALVK